MKSSTKALIDQVRRPGEVVYELFRKPKRSFIFQVLDTLFDLILPPKRLLHNDKSFYLLASEKYGKIIEIEDEKIVKEVRLLTWKSNMKYNFKKIEAEDQFIYKKYRKIS